MPIRLGTNPSLMVPKVSNEHALASLGNRLIETKTQMNVLGYLLKKVNNSYLICKKLYQKRINVVLKMYSISKKKIIFLSRYEMR